MRGSLTHRWTSSKLLTVRSSLMRAMTLSKFPSTRGSLTQRWKFIKFLTMRRSLMRYRTSIKLLTVRSSLMRDRTFRKFPSTRGILTQRRKSIKILTMRSSLMRYRTSIKLLTMRKSLLRHRTFIKHLTMRRSLTRHRVQSISTSVASSNMQLGVGAWNPRKRTAILLSFSTYTPDGLLFFVGKDRDQLFVELVDGRVSLSFVLGSGAVKLLSDKSSYNDGQWHMISIDRMERRAKLEVDGADVQEGKSAVTMFEASVSGAFYPGGLPKNVQTRFTVQPFRGCLKNLKLDTEYINLDNAHYSKGVQSSRPTREERLATLISERSQATLSKLSATKDVDLSLRFRTRQSTAHIASVTSNEEELLKIELDNGVLVVKSNGEEADVVRAEVPSGTEGRWHLISV
ncbi:laminin-like protein K08C7.3 precursor, partial [Aphelenchoides avenae]